MTHPIRFGDISIRDTNQNDFYDPGIDSVLDPGGHTVILFQAQRSTDKILKEMGGLSWQGVSLSTASRFYLEMNQAEGSARSGDYDSLLLDLGSAQSYASQLPFQISPKRIEALKRKALMGGMKKNYHKADQLSRKGGDIDAVQDALKISKDYLIQYNALFSTQLIFPQIQANEILKRAYVKGIPNLYKQAHDDAQQGNIRAAEMTLESIQKHIIEGNKAFALGIKYSQAQEDLIMRKAFQFGIPREWAGAFKLAGRGQTMVLRRKLTHIQNFIQDANQNYGLSLTYDMDLEDDVMELGLREGIRDNLKIALRMALQGDTQSAGKWLDVVEDYTDEYNHRFAWEEEYEELELDTNLANEIIGCSNGWNPCPELNF